MSENEGSKYFPEKCSLENVEELFEEMELYGVQSLPEIKQLKPHLSPNDAMKLIKSLVNASYHMLYRHRKILREYEELEMKRIRNLDDNRTLNATVERLKRELVEKDRALLKRDEKVKKMNEELSRAQQEFKVLSEEARQLRCQLKYNEKKNTHNIRKKDQEINKLQMMLEQKSGSRIPKKSSATEIYKEGKSSEIPKENEETYQQIICKFEANNKTLLLENEIVRKALHKLNTNLSSLVADFHTLLLFFPKEESKKFDPVVWQDHDKHQETTEILSLEESIALSNNYIESLTALIDNLKQKYI